MRPIRVGLRILWGGLAIAASLGSLAQVRAQATTVAVETKAAAPLDTNTCFTCHEAVFSQAFIKSHHAGLEQACASCHKGADEHSKAMQAGADNPPIPSIKKLSSAQINETCLSCHDKGRQANWAGGLHDRRNLNCTTCHGVHEYKSEQHQLKTAQDPETCYACHPTMRAKSMRTSHHPVREGKMSCASCHDPHNGAQPKMIKADSVNELCYTCHAEKRGPFLFEHAPVREDCASCHDAHGTNHKRLLVQKLPNLCWNCHLTGSGHFGSGDNLSTELGARVAPAGAPSGYPTVNSRFVEKNCKNCHANLHGSNSPSGAFFVR